QEALVALPVGNSTSPNSPLFLENGGIRSGWELSVFSTVGVWAGGSCNLCVSAGMGSTGIMEMESEWESTLETFTVSVFESISVLAMDAVLSSNFRDWMSKGFWVCPPT